MKQPATITVHKKSAMLELSYEGGTRHLLPAEYLRVFSPSAEVRGHGPGQAVLQAGKKHIQFRDIEPQGHYAIKITFSDDHDSGIYSWEYLRTLGENQQQNWAGYLADLEAAGKSRDSRFIALDS